MESFMASRSLGEESLQMWGLNKRLEAYLARVKSLEEENGLLRSEIQSLKAGPPDGGSCWRGHYEEELAALRATLDQAFREKHAAEVARLALSDQVQEVTGQCQKERAAREEAKRALAAGKKALEEERRAQLWLREKAAQLEKEAKGLAEAHREELAGLEQEAAGFPRSFGGFQGAAPVCPQPLEVEDYAQRLSAIWQGAVETYKCGVSQVEASLSQAKEELRRAVQGNRQSRLQLQQMETELAGLQSRKEALEESLSHQGQLQQGEAEKLQLAVETLEEEKRSLRAQIAQVLEDRQQLAHLKMSLSLEVATYRTLLEAESTRLQMPTAVDFKLPSSLKDLRAEANGSKPQVMSREPWPSPAAFLRGNARPWSTMSLGKPSLASSPASLLPKSRSPVAREFQKAKTVLQSQSAKGFDPSLTQEEAPVLVESAAFQLGASQQSQVVTATQTESVSQSFFRESPPVFDSISPDILEESSPKEKVQEGGEGGEATGTHMEKVEGVRMKEDASEVAREEEEEEEVEEEEEEEKYPSGRPPGETPSQLITEALAIATKEENSRDTPPESSLLSMMETQNGFPSNDSSSLEEENEATPAPSGKGLEGMEELHKDLKGDGQPADWPEDIEGFEASVEVNGGQEAHAEHQEEEEGLWVSRDLGPPSLLESRPSEEKIIEEQIAMDTSITEGMEIYKETKSPEQDKSDDVGQTPAFLLDEPEAASECPAPAHHVEKELLAEKESWEAGAGHCQDPAGATGGSVDEAEGGTEDLEVVSTEALHLSEDEERRELWSPSRENEEECDLQAEMPGSEFRMEEGGPAAENLSPLNYTALPLERCQKDLFLQVEQEKTEEGKIPLCQTDSSLPEEEAEEVALEPEAFIVEETLSGGDNSASNEENTLPGETGVMDSRGAEEEEGEESIALPRDVQEEENDLGNEDTAMKEGFSGMEAVSLQEVASEHQEVENVVLEQEISTGEQVEGAREESPQQLRTEQEMEEEEISAASPEVEDRALEEAKVLRCPEATEAEKEEEGIAGQVIPNIHLEEKDRPPEASEATTEAQGAAGEQQIVAGKEEEASQSQQGTALGQSAILDASRETEAPSEVQSDILGGSEGPSHTDTSDPQPQNDSLESEESLESPDTSPNATYAGEGIGKELETGRESVLEETLPDHTPLCAYEAEALAMTSESQRLPDDEDAARDGYEFLKEETEQVLEDRGPSSPSPREKDKEQEGFEEEESCPVESEETPAAKDMEETERPEPLQEENQDPHIAKPELSRAEEHFALYPEPSEPESEKEAEGRRSQEGGDVGKEAELAEQTLEGEAGVDFAWKPEMDSVFQADSFDPSSVEESVPAEDGGSLELSDQEEVEAEGPHKDSPLTSVADLGEIVLEEEGPLGLQRATEAEAKDLTCAEIAPGAPEPCQTSKLESHGRDEEPQEEDPAELRPRAKGFPDPSPEAAMSSSLDSMKDSDILEIVEQALEFNQELIKAAEQSTEAGPPSTGGEAPLSPEEKGPDVSATSPDRGEPQIVKEVPEVSSSSAKDPAESPHLWAESTTNGLQADPSIVEFSGEMLNGLEPLLPKTIEQDVSTAGEGQVKKIMISEELPREEMDDDLPMVDTASHSPPQTPSTVEAPRVKEDGSETHEEAFLGHQGGREALEAPQSIFAEILQTARGKEGRERDPEDVSIAPDFGEDLLCLQPSQNLKFRPEEEDEEEEEEEPWSLEGN